MSDDKLTPAEFLEINKIDTFSDALDYWLSSKDHPIPYVPWQKIYNQIRRLYVGKDPAVARKVVHLVSTECAAAWRTRMGELHGEDWRAKLARRERKAETRSP